jgi:hypothetical protein
MWAQWGGTKTDGSLDLVRFALGPGSLSRSIRQVDEKPQIFVQNAFYPLSYDRIITQSSSSKRQRSHLRLHTMKNWKALGLAAASVALTAGLAACSTETPAPEPAAPTKPVEVVKQKAGAAGTAAGDAMKKTGDAAGKAAGAMKDGADKAGGHAGDAMKHAGDAAGKAGDAAGKAGEAIKDKSMDGMKHAGDAAKDAAGKTGDAVKSAGEAVKKN